MTLKPFCQQARLVAELQVLARDSRSVTGIAEAEASPVKNKLDTRPLKDSKDCMVNEDRSQTRDEKPVVCQ